MTQPVSSDAELLELGRQFEAAKAKVQAAEPEMKRLYDLSEEIADLRGIPPLDIQAREKIRRKLGYEPAYQAVLKPHTVAVRLMKAIYSEKATTLAGFAVKVAAITFDQFDFEIDPIGDDRAERQLLQLCKEMQAATKGDAK